MPKGIRTTEQAITEAADKIAAAADAATLAIVDAKATANAATTVLLAIETILVRIEALFAKKQVTLPYIPLPQDAVPPGPQFWCAATPAIDYDRP